VKNFFTYSLLQYRHSLVLNEAVNIGIFFVFPDDRKIDFIYDESNRVRCLYDNFDSIIFNATLKYIASKASKKTFNLIDDLSTIEGIKAYINTHLLPEDSSSLQFSEVKNAVNVYGREKTINEFSKLLLPGINTKVVSQNKKDEAYIIKTFKTFLTEKDRLIENKIWRNRIVNDNKVEIKFEISWENKTTHLVKPISFDLKDKLDIQNKATQNLGSLSLLAKYAEKTNSSFDLLVTEPQEERLLDNYLNALEILKASPSPIAIISENKLKTYSEEAVIEINKHFGVEE
jgi:hypothetical protein